MSENERIDRYFSGEMDDLERSQFDQEVMSNPKFSAAVQNYKDLIIGVKSFGLQENIRSTMPEDLDSSSTPNENAPQSASRFRWWYLLLIAAAVGLFSWFYQPREKEINPTQQLYIAYYYPDPGLASTMGATSETAFADAMLEYKNGEYEDALKQWTSSAMPHDDKTTYYIGMCLHELKQHEAALTKLRMIESTSPYFQKALWYRSLIKLKLGDKETAVNNLTKLSKLPTSNYSERGRELLAKLIK